MSAENVPENEEINDYLEWFLERPRIQELAQSTINGYRIDLSQFREFLLQSQDKTLADATAEDARQWRQKLDEGSIYCGSSIGKKLSKLSVFYEYMANKGIFEVDIMVDISYNSDISSSHRREITLPEMREFVQQIKHPARRVPVVCLLKTGIRIGELCNLDLRDIHLDHDMINAAYDITPRPAIEGKPDSLYISNEISKGDVVNGEERNNSNKRSNSTIIPIDDELKSELVSWFDVRPDTDTPALFVQLAYCYGARITRGSFSGQLKIETEPHGWYKKGNGPEKNVTPHYFRHFFVTHHRQFGDNTTGLPDPVLTYLRGDSTANDMLERYTQQWGLAVQQAYSDGVYKLFR